MTFAFRSASTALAIAVVFAAGCAVPAPPAPPAQMSSPFNAADVAWSAARGTATVEGRAAIAAGGVSHTCAGSEAQLVPAGSYATEMMRMVFGNDARGYVTLASSPRYPASIAPDFSRTIRRVGCDAEGRFRFSDVPAGRWYVFSNVIWPSTGGEGTAPQGGALMQRVEVAEGASANVLLAP
jgi:hypothetical protein